MSNDLYREIRQREERRARRRAYLMIQGILTGVIFHFVNVYFMPVTIWPSLLTWLVGLAFVLHLIWHIFYELAENAIERKWRHYQADPDHISNARYSRLSYPADDGEIMDDEVNRGYEKRKHGEH